MRLSKGFLLICSLLLLAAISAACGGGTSAEKPAANASPASTRVPAPAAESTGSLEVDSRPLGANVFLDGVLVGTTPVEMRQVPVGEHTVRLEHDGYRRWSSPVRIVGGERNRVTASLEQ